MYYPNRLISLLFFFISIGLLHAQSPESASSGTQVLQFTSAINQQDYVLQICLPDSYSTGNQHYPVLYVLDGQWDFPVIAGERGLQSSLFHDGLAPEMIVVGISWPGDYERNRGRDFSPTPIKEIPGSGGARKFLNVLQQEIIQKINAAYRCDPGKKALTGGAFGGLFTLYTLFQEPALFNRIIAWAPVLAYDDGVIFKIEKVFAQKNKVLNARVLVSTGEYAKPADAGNINKFIAQIKTSSYEGLVLENLLVPQLGPLSEAPYAIARGLQFVFNGPEIAENTAPPDQPSSPHKVVAESKNPVTPKDSLTLPRDEKKPAAGRKRDPNNCILQIRVTDAQTGEALDGVTFKLDGLGTGITTDSSGRIRMPVSCDKHLLKFQVLGYKPFSQHLVVSGETPVDVRMESISTQIEEIVVSSQSAIRTLETPALGVNTLSMRAVQRLPPAAGEVDLLRGLQTLPGISAVGEGANGINVRGGSVDQNLILLDNMPIFNPTHMLGLFSLFPTDAVREMQIYKGSIPARYGGRTAGVLDVKLSEPDLDKFRMRGGIGVISNRLHAEIPILKGRLAWMTSARFSFNEYLIKFYNLALAGTVGPKLPDSHPVFVDFVNKIAWRPTAQDNISFTSYVSYDSYRVDSLFSISNIVPHVATMKYGHNNLGLRWNHYFSDQLNLNVLAVRSHYSTTTAARDLKAGFDYATDLLYHNAKAELTYAPSKRQRVNTGLTLTRYDLQPAELSPIAGSSVSFVRLPQEQAWETAVFASDEYELSHQLLAEIGFRYVHYWNMGPLSIPVYDPETPKSPNSINETVAVGKNDVESQYGRLEPRLALRYKLNEQRSVKIGYNRMNQFLQMIANNSTPLPSVRWKMTNRYVPPAQSDLVSAGYFQENQNRKWEWSVEGYYRWQRSIFDYLNGAELNINPLVETQLLKGSGKAYGAELLINKKKGVMTGWLSYTYARSLEKITGDFPDLQKLNHGDWFRTNIDKPHTFNAVVNFQTEKHNAVSFTFVYSTGRPYTAPVSFYKNGFNIFPVFTERNNARISAYHRLDFSWTINNPSMKDRRWESSWVVTIYNIYGRKNAFSYFFDPNLATFQPFKISVFPSPIFSLTYNFKFE